MENCFQKLKNRFAFVRSTCKVKVGSGVYLWAPKVRISEIVSFTSVVTTKFQGDDRFAGTDCFMYNRHRSASASCLVATSEILMTKSVESTRRSTITLYSHSLHNPLTEMRFGQYITVHYTTLRTNGVCVCLSV